MEKIVKKAAFEGGKVLLKYFRSAKLGQPDYRTRKKLVTRADLESEKKIISILQEKFPHYNILSEEIGKIKKGSAFTWVIDPLDGTTNFSMGNPFYGVSLALLKEEEPQLGIVYAPSLDEFYYAQKGKGAYLNNKRIRVSQVRNLSSAFTLACEGGEEGLKRFSKIFYKVGPKVRELRKLGSAAIECAWIASGKADAYLTTQIHPWDVAAGVLLVKEAEGKVSDFLGKNWDPKKEKSDFIASNGKTHEKILKIVKNL